MTLQLGHAPEGGTSISGSLGEAVSPRREHHPHRNGFLRRAEDTGWGPPRPHQGSGSSEKKYVDIVAGVESVDLRTDPNQAICGRETGEKVRSLAAQGGEDPFAGFFV